MVTEKPFLDTILIFLPPNPAYKSHKALTIDKTLRKKFGK